MLSNQLNKYQINISDFEVIKLINKKVFSSSYQVRNKKTQIQYFAKVISMNKTIKMDQMINHEIKNMVCVTSPTFINFLGFSKTDFSGSDNIINFTNDSFITFIMDYVEQGSLFNIFENKFEGVYDETAKQIILIGISYGMMKLHQNFIIHGNLKPENVLIDKSFHPHICDFGISKIINNLQSKICDKTIYTAPEIINGEIYDGRSDVYSFGIIMLAILSNSNSKSLFESIQKVSSENPIPEISVPIKEPFKELIQKCLSVDPYDRPLFQEIFNKLSFDDIYRLETVNDNQIFSYIEYIIQDDNQYTQLGIRVIREQKKKIHDLSFIIQKLTKTEEEINETNENNDYTIPPPPPPPPPQQLRPYYIEPTGDEKKVMMINRLGQLEQILKQEEKYWISNKQLCSNYDKPRLEYLDEYIDLQKKLRLIYPEMTRTLRNRVSNLISILNKESCKNQEGLIQYNYYARGIGTFVSRSTVDTVIQRLKTYM